MTGEGARTKIVGIDPGATKCGYATVYEDGSRAALEVVPTPTLAQRIGHDTRDGRVSAICIGDATTSAAVVRLCRERWPTIPIAIIDERNTTWEARRLYYLDNPPRGWQRFVPRGLLVPSVALDGYAALLIIERYRRLMAAPPP